MNVLELLFWNFDGEVVFCKECNKAKVIEYESSLSRKLGYMFGYIIMKIFLIAVSRMQQKGGIKDRIVILEDRGLFPELIDIGNIPKGHKKKSTYLKCYGICNECSKKEKAKMNFDDKHLLGKYLHMVNEFKNKKKSIEWDTYRDIAENATPELLAEINPQAFEKLKNSKHFGIKKEKRRLAERYINEAMNDIVSLVQKRVDKDTDLQKIKEEIVELEEEIRKFIEDCGEEIKSYTVISRNFGFIPNPDKQKKLSEMFPDKIFTNEKFYDVEKFYKKEIQGILDDAEKLNCTVVKWADSIFVEMLYRLSIKISKMDFWSK